MRKAGSYAKRSFNHLNPSVLNQLVHLHTLGIVSSKTQTRACVFHILSGPRTLNGTGPLEGTSPLLGRSSVGWGATPGAAFAVI